MVMHTIPTRIAIVRQLMLVALLAVDLGISDPICIPILLVNQLQYPVDMFGKKRSLKRLHTVLNVYNCNIYIYHLATMHIYSNITFGMLYIAIYNMYPINIFASEYFSSCMFRQRTTKASGGT